MRVRHLLIAALSLLVFSCDNPTTPTTTTTLPPTALQVTAELHRSIDPVDSTSEVTWYFDIAYNGVPIDGSAVVMVNSVQVVPYLTWSWNYMYDSSDGATYTPGQTYTVSVTYGGHTYTETMTAPGNITISSDYRQVSWSYGGDFSVVSANYTFGSGTYQMPGSLGTLTSPLAVPASAYPSAGQYDLNVNIGSYKGYFGSLHGSESHLWMYDYTRRRFTK